MLTSELLLHARKIADNYVTNGTDLNESIAKIASKEKLSKDMINRLVEESNKATFLVLLEQKGEQVFPVADYSIIRNMMTPVVEKKASESFSFQKLEYAAGRFKDALSERPTIEKTANEKDRSISENELAYAEAFYKVACEYKKNYDESIRIASTVTYGLEKQAAADKIRELDKVLEKQAKVMEIILEKIAAGENPGMISSMLWGESNLKKAIQSSNANTLVGKALHGTGALVNAGFKGLVKIPLSLIGGGAMLATKGALKVAPVVAAPALAYAVRNPLKTLTGTLNVSQGAGVISKGLKNSEMIGSAPQIMERLASVTKEAGAIKLFTGPLLTVVDGVSKMTKTTTPQLGSALAKTADWRSGLQHAIDFVVPGVILGNPFAGIAAAAAKKLGGGIALTMNKREFEKSFETIAKNNPDLDKEQARKYFDVISRHAPSLAKDPLVAESIVKNMNAFGGVDYNTVRGLRETENLGNKSSDKHGLSGLIPFSM